MNVLLGQSQAQKLFRTILNKRPGDRFCTHLKRKKRAGTTQDSGPKLLTKNFAINAFA